MRGRVALSAVALSLTVGLVMPTATAQEADFTPDWNFALSTRKAKGNPSVTINVTQELGEEELQHVTLQVPAGFTLPTDEQINNDEQMGSGEIVINTGAECASGTNNIPDPPIPVNIVEVDRSEEQISAGVVAVWRVDLQPVTTIDLIVTGSKGTGWNLDGDIPQNPATCPPFQFSATINPTTPDTGTKIFVNPNPKVTKPFTFVAESQSTVGTLHTDEQVIKIRGRRRR